MRSKTYLLVLCMLLLFINGCAGGNGGGAGTAEKQEVISIGVVPYPQEWIPAHIIKNVAEEMGYQVKLVEGDIGFMFLGLSQGDIDIFPDIWLPTLHKTYIDKYREDFELVRKLYENIDIGWAVPTYVDIDSIADLKGRGEEFDNRIIGIEPSSGIMLTSERTIDAYDLEDEYTLLEGSTAAMLAAVEKATANNDSIVSLAWRPHTMFTRFDIKLLEDPKGIWVFDDVHTGVTNGFKEKAPDLYSFLQNFSLTINEIESILQEMEESEKDIEVLVQEWMDENRDRLDEMMEK